MTPVSPPDTSPRDRAAAILTSWQDGAQAPDARVLEEVQRSHIEENVPPPAEFSSLLQRDLEAYFNSAREKTSL